MERQIGEIFKNGNITLKVVEIKGVFDCTGCYFENMPHSTCMKYCAPYNRKDKKSVIFIRQDQP